MREGAARLAVGSMSFYGGAGLDETRLGRARPDEAWQVTVFFVQNLFGETESGGTRQDSSCHGATEHGETRVAQRAEAKASTLSAAKWFAAERVESSPAWAWRDAAWLNKENLK
jgi:hypothetical protein